MQQPLHTFSDVLWHCFRLCVNYLSVVSTLFLLDANRLNCKQNDKNWTWPNASMLSFIWKGKIVKISAHTLIHPPYDVNIRKIRWKNKKNEKIPRSNALKLMHLYPVQQKLVYNQYNSINQYYFWLSTTFSIQHITRKMNWRNGETEWMNIYNRKLFTFHRVALCFPISFLYIL